MKRIALFTVVAVFFCMTAMLGSTLTSPVQAETDAKAQPSRTDRAEARISDLHAKLKITEAQEKQWSSVAQVMRENAAEMESLVKARKEKGSTLNAVDDLKSYSTIADAHAAGLKKFIPAFEALYADLSADQKQAADKLFTKIAHRGKQRKK
jgi:translation initiation factor 2B subunit (eIF-2B alpha/beta/delta family)